MYKLYIYTAREWWLGNVIQGWRAPVFHHNSSTFPHAYPRYWRLRGHQGRLLPRSEMPLFSRLFTCEGNVEYTGCSSTEQRGLKAREVPWLPTLPRLAWGKVGGGACFALWWKLKRACHTQGLSKNAQLKATAHSSCIRLYMMWCKSQMLSHVRTLW